MTPPTLKHRAALLRLPQAELARMAGVDKHTVGRVLSGRRDALQSTVAAIAAAIEAEERRVRGGLERQLGGPAPAPVVRRGRRVRRWITGGEARAAE